MIVSRVLAIIPSLIAAFPLSRKREPKHHAHCRFSLLVNDREKARTAHVRDPFASAQGGRVQDFKEMLPADGMMAAQVWSSASPIAARSKSNRVF